VNRLYDRIESAYSNFNLSSQEKARIFNTMFREHQLACGIEEGLKFSTV
jgi:hypothetical protein